MVVRKEIFMNKIHLPMKFKKVFAIGLLSVFVFASPAMSDEKLSVALLPSVKADPSKISLRQILDEKNTSPEIISKYGDVSVSSNNGLSIQPVEALVALSRAGADLKTIRLNSTNDCELTSFKDQAVLEQVKSAILAKIETDPQNKDAVLDFTNVPDNLPAVDSFSKINIEARPSEAGQNSRKFMARFMGDGDITLKTAEFGVSVQVKRQVVVSKRALTAGESVSSDMFAEEVRNVDDSDGLVTHLSEIGTNHWQVLESIPAGTPVKKSSFNFASQMTRGALVTLVSGDKHFSIRVLGRVKDVMDDGGTVLVENLDSKKELMGRPISSSEVQIVY